MSFYNSPLVDMSFYNSPLVDMSFYNSPLVDMSFYNSPLVDMSFHSDSLSWLVANQYIIFALFHQWCMPTRKAENANYVVFGLTRLGLSNPQYTVLEAQTNYCTTSIVTVLDMYRELVVF